MKIVIRIFFINIFLNLSLQALEIDQFYEAYESNDDHSLSARLSLFSLKVTDELKKKARYKLSVKKNVDGAFERIDSWNLSLNLTHDLISSELLFFDGGIEGRYQLKRFYKSQKEAFLAKIISPAKIPVRAEDINFLGVGSTLKVPLEARFGLKLSPSAYAPYQFIKGDVYALFKGLINLHLIRETKHKVRVILVVATGNEKGTRLETGLLSPEIVFSVLGHEVDKVFDFNLYGWTRNISLVKGKIADYRIDLSQNEGKSCYNDFFKNYFKLKGPKFHVAHESLRLKSLSLLHECSKRTFAVKELLFSRVRLSEQDDRKKLNIGVYRNDLDYKQVSIAMKESQNINRFNFMRKNWNRKNYIPIAKNKAREIYEVTHVKEKNHDENGFQFKFSVLDTKLSKENISRANQLISFVIEELDQINNTEKLREHFSYQGKVDLKITLQFYVDSSIGQCLDFQDHFYRHFDYLNNKYPNFFKSLYTGERSDLAKERMIESRVYETGLQLCYLMKEQKSKKALEYLNKSKFFYFLAPSFFSKISKKFHMTANINGNQMSLGSNTDQNSFDSFHRTHYFNDVFNLNL